MARFPESHRASDATPILNGPYEEPEFHYATTTDGNLDYEDKRRGPGEVPDWVNSTIVPWESCNKPSR